MTAFEMTIELGENVWEILCGACGRQRVGVVMLLDDDHLIARLKEHARTTHKWTSEIGVSLGSPHYGFTRAVRHARLFTRRQAELELKKEK